MWEIFLFNSLVCERVAAWKLSVMPSLVVCLCSAQNDTKEFRVNNTNYRVFIVQTYQTSQYVVPRGGIFLGQWRRSFAGNSDGKMNVQSACALNTQNYILTEYKCVREN
jgi:hypothetical protein